MKTKRLLLAPLLVVLALVAPRPAYAEDAVPPPSNPSRVPHVLLGAGLSYGQLFGIGARATAIEGGLVVDMSRHVALSVGADVELGKMTIAELPMGDVAVFGTIDGVAGRFRFGAGPQLSYFWMSRTTASSAPTIDAIGLGARARVSVDLLRFDDERPEHSRGIFLAVSPDFEWLRGPSKIVDFTTGTLAWRANATVGLRF